MKLLKIKDTNIPIYKDGDNNNIFSPFLWFYHTYKQIPCELRINKKFNTKLVEFLFKNAEVITFFKSIRQEKNDSELSIFGDREPQYSKNGNSKYGYYFLYKERVLHVYGNEEDCSLTVIGAPNKVSESEFDKFILIKTDSAHVSLLIKEYGDIVLKDIEMPLYKDFDIALNYGEDFIKVHDDTINKLKTRGGGLYHFSGYQGTGKTTFLKYLTSVVNREFIFVPVTLTECLNSPDFLSLLLEHKNSVLIIEDAEKILTARDNNENSLVSLVLNMSDGILSSVLNISIIVTHNTNRNNLDKALLRKGRLFIDYEFQKLKIEDAQKLVNHLKINFKVNQPMSLADIYNIADNNFLQEEKEEKRIGF